MVHKTTWQNRTLQRGSALYILLVMTLLVCSPPPLTAADGVLIFADDFAGDDVGAPPSRWVVRSNAITVVADDEAVGGKAVRMQGTPNQGTFWYVDLSIDGPVVVIEHALRRAQADRGVNFYLDDDLSRRMDKHNVNWVLRRDFLLYRYTHASGETEEAIVGALDDGWNQIKIVADAANNEAYVYLNDMDTPALGPLPFRTPVQSGRWDKARLMFWDTGHVEELTDIYFDDIKLWKYEAVEEMPAASAVVRPSRSSIMARDLPPKLPVRELRPPVRDADPVAFMSVPLTITERLNIERRNQPVTSGVPLPEGQLFDPTQLRLLDELGNAIPLQTEVLAWWPDGSIRWILLSFRISVEPGATRQLTLQYGSQVVSSVAQGTLIQGGTDTGLVVETGLLSFTPDGSQAPAHNGSGWYWSGFPVLRVRDRDGYVYRSDLLPGTIEVEENGPERAVLRVHGDLATTDANARGVLTYDLRVYFYKDGAAVRIDPVITNARPYAPDGSNNIQLAEVSLVFPGWLAGEPVIGYETAYQLASDIRAHVETLGVGVPKKTVPDAAVHVTKGQVAGTFAVVQRGLSHLAVTADDVTTFLSDHRSAGWVRFALADRTVGVGVRHFWQQYPKGIEVTVDGDLAVHLWADDPDSSARFLTLSGGEGKRHELYVSLENEPHIQSLLHPLFAAAPPSWYSETKGMGRPFLLYEPELHPFLRSSIARYEQKMEEAFVEMLQNREKAREYGWRNFGDWATTWDPDGWGNTEYDLARGLFLRFARTGDLDYLQFAEEAVRHYMDVDIVWAAGDISWLGGGIVHSTGHRSKGVHMGHTWVEGLLDYYLLTGDRRALEAARLSGDWFAWHALRPSIQGTRISSRTEARGPGWALIGLSRLLQLGDGYYAHAAQAVVDILRYEQTADGQWIFPIPDNELPGEGNPLLTKPFMTGIILTGLVNYESITGDPVAKDLIVSAVRFLVDNMWDDRVGGFPYVDHPRYSASPGNFRILNGILRAYELTGEERFLAVARRYFDASVQHFPVEPENIGKQFAIALKFAPMAMAGVAGEPQPYALTTDRSVRLYKDGLHTLNVQFHRFSTDGRHTGSVRLTGLPEGLLVDQETKGYVLEAGERTANVEFRLAVGDTLVPGSYTVHIEETTSNLTEVVTIVVPGWTKSDDFRPPVTSGWFAGLVSFTQWLQESGGWTYAEDPEQQYGHAHRLVRKGNTEEYVIYDTPGLLVFEFDVLMPEADTAALASQVEVWVCSPHDTGEKGANADAVNVAYVCGGEERPDHTWMRVELDVEWKLYDGLPYAKATVVPQVRFNGKPDLLKIVVKGPGASEWPQLGRLRIEGWQLAE